MNRYQLVKRYARTALDMPNDEDCRQMFKAITRARLEDAKVYTRLIGACTRRCCVKLETPSPVGT